MYFFKQNKKQQLDLSGNLVLTKNKQFIRAKSRINAPKRIYNARFIKLRKLGFFGRIKASWHTLSYIWSRI